jgi:hypothetical protein
VEQRTAKWINALIALSWLGGIRLGTRETPVNVKDLVGVEQSTP